MPEPLQPNQPKAELRKHYFLDDFVATTLQTDVRRALVAARSARRKAAGAPDNCNFDRPTGQSIWHTPKTSAGQVRILAHDQPHLSLDNAEAFGKQEYVVDTSDHGVRFSELSPEHIKDILEAYSHRLNTLKRIQGVDSVVVTKDSRASDSRGHAHSQIHALPFVPAAIKRENEALKSHFMQNNTCAYCDAISWEESQKVRIISKDKNLTAFSPYASKNPFEAWITPIRHLDSLSAFRNDELRSLAIIIKKVVAKLDAYGLDYSYFLQESLTHQNQHFVLKIQPLLTTAINPETHSGVHFNPVSPEFASLWYRGQLGT